ncbi:MAG: alpha/beta hydrolase [Clostridia bacterium]|nr:alpha/beta hydrolase [Clostridia bacterium]
MKRLKIKKLLWIVPLSALVLLTIAFFIYTGQYYHADSAALSALESDDVVTVTQTDYGWLFDGPSESDALIFYQGAKVEETAYAPLMRLIAREGMDVLLVRMPFRLAFFGVNKANSLISRYDYNAWYIGGHSLGGAMAANYAAKHGEQLKGLILLAAYPTKPLDDELTVVSICGSADEVINREKMSAGDAYLPEKAVKCVIEGGNHAQFGNYGKQAEDGEPSITSEEQQKQTVEMIIKNK